MPIGPHRDEEQDDRAEQPLQEYRSIGAARDRPHTTAVIAPSTRTRRPATQSSPRRAQCTGCAGMCRASMTWAANSRSAGAASGSIRRRITIRSVLNSSCAPTQASMPMGHADILAKRASSWPRDHLAQHKCATIIEPNDVERVLTDINAD